MRGFVIGRRWLVLQTAGPCGLSAMPASQRLQLIREGASSAATRLLSIVLLLNFCSQSYFVYPQGVTRS